jgi:hypothetical protein
MWLIPLRRSVPKGCERHTTENRIELWKSTYWQLPHIQTTWS